MLKFRQILPRFIIQRNRNLCTARLPSEADAVVIGGGSIGCNTLYHLTKLGVRNCILIERDKITSGTTWHTAGLLWRLRPSDVDIQLLARTRELNAEILEQETGQPTGWIENGGLFIANNAERLNEYKRLMTLGKCFGVESYVLDPSETKKLYPLMNVDDLYGTLYSPKDGLIDPSALCSGLVRAAQKNGAKVYENCSVSNIRTSTNDFGTKCVDAVETSKGIVKTKIVVNCAGAWSVKIGRMAGVNVPLIAMKHAYVITDKIDGIRNMPNVRDHDASVYLKLQGDALAIGGYEPNPVFWDKVREDFAFSLFELDWDVFSVHIKGAINRVPILKSIGIKSEICGPESFTPDHRALMGESPEVRGFYLGCGFNSAGMMLGGGCGQQLAQWIINGRPELHMYSYDVRRFSSRMTNDEEWIRQRSHESYANNYQIVFPYDEPLACRPKRTDPLYDRLMDNGCVFQERLGWERPSWFAVDGRTSPTLPYDYYGSYGHRKHEGYVYKERVELDHTFDFPKHHEIIGDECNACRTKVAVFDMSYFGKFYLIGDDSQKAADWIFTNSMQKPVGTTTYTCMLNDRGGVEADLTVSVLEPNDDGSNDVHRPKFVGRCFYVAAGGGIAEHVRRHIEKELETKKFNVRLLDVTDHMSMISVQGPRSRALLQEICPKIQLTDEFLPFSTHKLVEIANHRCRIVRLSFVGELGYELHLPNENALAVYDAIMKVGSKYGVRNAGYRAIDSLSIEKGYRLWGTDLRSTDTPLEAGLGFTCKLKSDVQFKGRSALEAQKRQGLTKKMVCLTLNDHRPMWGLEAIYHNGVVVGFVRRADFAFTIQKSIVHGYVMVENGQKLRNDWLNGKYEIESMGVKYEANLHMTPVFDPNNQRLKGVYDF